MNYYCPQQKAMLLALEVPSLIVAMSDKSVLITVKIYQALSKIDDSSCWSLSQDFFFEVAASCCTTFKGKGTLSNLLIE